MTRATLTIDLDAITANWRALDALSAPGVETAAVVKADAYGLGIAPVARALRDAGARSFFVAQAEEAPPLREAIGPAPDIYVFAGLMRGDEDALQSASAIPLLNDPGQLERFERWEKRGRCGIQIDSGMHRLGFQPTDLTHAQARISALAPVLTISHLACSDDPSDPQNAAQRDAFAAAPHWGRASLAATGGILLGAEYHHAMTRPGIGLYGGRPFADAAPTVTLSLPVVQVRDVAAGGAVGYGAAWRAARPSRIATLSSGYADGLIRAMGHRAQLFAGDIPCPLAGRVSMDLLTVDVSHLPQVPDTLDILGPHQTVDDLAQAAGTIGYEILTSLGPRYERVYKGG